MTIARLADTTRVWSDEVVRHHRFNLHLPRRRHHRRTMWESWVMLSDDPPSLCCSGDDLCDACRL